MAHDMITAVRIREALAGRKIVEQWMMGALCFMVDGHMCCCTKDNTIMVRVGAEAHAAMLNEPHVRPFEMRGRCVAGFVRVAAEGYATEVALAKWIARGLDFIATLPANPATQKRGEARCVQPTARSAASCRACR